MPVRGDGRKVPCTTTQRAGCIIAWREACSPGNGGEQREEGDGCMGQREGRERDLESAESHFADSVRAGNLCVFVLGDQ